MQNKDFFKNLKQMVSPITLTKYILGLERWRIGISVAYTYSTQQNKLHQNLKQPDTQVCWNSCTQ